MLKCVCGHEMPREGRCPEEGCGRIVRKKRTISSATCFEVFTRRRPWPTANQIRYTPPPIPDLPAYNR